MVQIGWCAKDDSLCLLSHYMIVVLVLLIIAFAVDLSIKYGIVPKLLKYIKSPNPKNIHLFLGSVYGDEYTLKVCNREWRRFPLSKLLVFVEVRFDREKGESEWRRQNTTTPLIIGWLGCSEINFLKVDAVKNVFSIDAKHNDPLSPKSIDPIEMIEFSPGTYWFGMAIISRSLGRKQAIRYQIVTQYTVEVIYRGAKQVQMIVK